MPCDQIRSQVVDWQKACPTTLADALEAKGWRVDRLSNRVVGYKRSAIVDLNRGVLTTTNIEPNAVRVIYSEEVVRTVAAAYGWEQEIADDGTQTLTKAW